MLGGVGELHESFGYQTNLMVYGPGGYAFKDFLRFGVPMQLFQLVASVAVIVIGGKLWFVSLAQRGDTLRRRRRRQAVRGRGKLKLFRRRGRGLARRLLASGRATRETAVTPRR